MWARWKLGQLIKALPVAPGARTDRTSSPRVTRLKSEILQGLGLTKKAANEAEHIGSAPATIVEKALAMAHAAGDLCTFRELLKLAKPYWRQDRRKQRHLDIEAIAREATRTATAVGPFPLIYADPPWKFVTYSDKAWNTPDDQYPTLTDEQITSFRVNGKLVSELAHKDAGLFLWCTSANIVRALEVMQRWGFTYKSQAVWDKERFGTGLIFLNQHEVLLYGTRGDMPAPQYRPPSVFRYQRTQHSAKPPQIRATIERMFPVFTKETRCELFARGNIPNWTAYGYEATERSDD
jgi:N6-adenosine-specific RNA methylase IME4